MRGMLRQTRHLTTHCSGARIAGLSSARLCCYCGSSRPLNSSVRCLPIMSELHTGKRGEYCWLERPVCTEDTSRPLAYLLKQCPEFVLHSYVVITSLDSGPMRLTKQQEGAGWRGNCLLAISPRISDTGYLPFGWFDEWYIFDEPATLVDVEVFINYGTFSLGDSRSAIDTMYIGPDEEITARLVEGASEMREQFWTQMERIKPKSYMANGNNFTLVTRDARLFRDAVGALASL